MVKDCSHILILLATKIFVSFIFVLFEFFEEVKGENYCLYTMIFETHFVLCVQTPSANSCCAVQRSPGPFSHWVWGFDLDSHQVSPNFYGITWLPSHFFFIPFAQFFSTSVSRGFLFVSFCLSVCPQHSLFLL